MANFIMYGYAKDTDFAAISLQALVRLRKPGERIIYLDDAFEPSPDSFIGFLRDIGVEYEQTNHPRNGNLIGPDHTKANFAILERYAYQANDQVCVKVDCDTLVLSRGWLDEFINSQVKELVGGFHSQINYMFGLCYAIKAPLAKFLVADLERNPPWIHCFEDYEISYRVHALRPRAIKRYALAKPANSRWYCVNPGAIPPGARADVLDVNRGAPREEVLSIMKNTLRAAMKADAERKENKNEDASNQDCSIDPDKVCGRCDVDRAGDGVCEGQGKQLLQEVNKGGKKSRNGSR